MFDSGSVHVLEFRSAFVPKHFLGQKQLFTRRTIHSLHARYCCAALKRDHTTNLSGQISIIKKRMTTTTRIQTRIFFGAGCGLSTLSKRRRTSASMIKKRSSAVQQQPTKRDSLLLLFFKRRRKKRTTRRKKKKKRRQRKKRRRSRSSSPFPPR